MGTYEKGKGPYDSSRRQAFPLVQITEPMTLILNNACNFQSSSHNICFLVILANSSLRHYVTLGPVQSHVAHSQHSRDWSH